MFWNDCATLRNADHIALFWKRRKPCVCDFKAATFCYLYIICITLSMFMKMKLFKQVEIRLYLQENFLENNYVISNFIPSIGRLLLMYQFLLMPRNRIKTREIEEICLLLDRGDLSCQRSTGKQKDTICV